jgi:ADP-heptose:LPS heptosyltransferase
VLVLRPGALGDTLLAVPALRALRLRFRPLVLAAHGPTAYLLETLDEVDAGIAFDDPSLGWVFRDELAAEDTVAWMTHAVRGALLQAPSRPTDAQHVAEYLVATLAPLGVAPELDVRPLKVTPHASDQVLMHVGSGSPAKNWPAGNFAETIRHLGAVRLIVGEADREVVAEVERLVGRDLPRLEAPLHELAQRLAGCRAYLGNDSGVSHLAGLCGARTVALFGPTSPTVWRPLGPKVSVMPFDASPTDVASAVAAWA